MSASTASSRSPSTTVVQDQPFAPGRRAERRSVALLFSCLCHTLFHVNRPGGMVMATVRISSSRVLNAQLAGGGSGGGDGGEPLHA